MPRGGKRAGAGRKPGATINKSREVADRAAAQGITPLEVMLEAMRGHHAKGEHDAAAKVAKDAAPYMHPRLQAIEMTGRGGGPVEYANLTEVELDRRIAEAEARVRAASGRTNPEAANDS